jgi:hypothetical protein
MALLGILPPYFPEDVHKAYKARALTAHPDRGGSPEEFIKLQEAYDQAQEYVRFRQGRRDWMANLVEPYVKQQEVVEAVQKRHGDVQIEKIDWMQHSFGDFATLTERLRGISLRGAADVDEFLTFLVGYNEHLRYLDELDLAGSGATDAGLTKIVQLQSLKRLNIANTRITADGLAAISELPDLEWLNLAGLSVSWWGRRALRSRLADVEIAF